MRKCLLRLEYENQTKCEAITSPTSKFYQKPQEYAMWKYAYYVCYKCKKVRIMRRRDRVGGRAGVTKIFNISGCAYIINISTVTSIMKVYFVQ